MKGSALATLCVIFMLFGAPAASAASQGAFGGASSAVQEAFAAVQSAGKDGGNISALVAELNGALSLIQKAASENSSDPAQAAADLGSALSIAQTVNATSASVAQQGLAARQLQFELSIGAAVAIVAVAVALYVYGDRIYHRLWLRIYGGHVVRRVG